RPAGADGLAKVALRPPVSLRRRARPRRPLRPERRPGRTRSRRLSFPREGDPRGLPLAFRLRRVPPAVRAAGACRRATACGFGRAGEPADREPARATRSARIAEAVDHPHHLQPPRKFHSATSPNKWTQQTSDGAHPFVGAERLRRRSRRNLLPPSQATAQSIERPSNESSKRGVALADFLV